MSKVQAVYICDSINGPIQIGYWWLILFDDYIILLGTFHVIVCRIELLKHLLCALDRYIHILDSFMILMAGNIRFCIDFILYSFFPLLFDPFESFKKRRKKTQQQ